MTDETMVLEDPASTLPTEEAFDPCTLPLGTFAAFPVSDEKEWLPYKDPGDRPGGQATAAGDFDSDPLDGNGARLPDDMLTQEQTNAVRAMVRAVSLCEPTARRLEVQNAWRQELMDRGFHNLKPADNYGWEVAGGDSKSKYGPYGSSVINGYYPTPTIGAYNDILVSALTRDVPRTRIFPVRPQNDGDLTAADAANKLQHFIAHDNRYEEMIAQIARYFCTDDRVVAYMAPWADAQAWGYEDDASEMAEVVPETEDESCTGEGGARGEASTRRPRIRSMVKLFGKLNDKCPLMAHSQRAMPWRQISWEWHKAIAKAMLPWVADEITGGGVGIAEIALDRIARCTVNLALQRTTGDSIENDVTMQFTWIRPEMYMDDSCPKDLRPWFWKTFPKGFLAVCAGDTLGFVRNESMDEVLVEMHSRSGQGQNRRSLTEAYVNPQLRLNNWVDLIDEFFRKTIPRVGLRADVWNVDEIRKSSVRVGVYEPFMTAPGEDGGGTMVQFPMPTHQPALPDFIKYFAEQLGELLTGAMPSLSASQADDPETLGQSRLQNANAMGRLAESWKSLCSGVSRMTVLGIRWAARVQPPSLRIDSILPGCGRLSVKIADLQGGQIDGYPESDTNFPETQAEREARWREMLQSASPLIQGIVNDPRNSTQVKQFMPEGTVVPQAEAVEKQQGEFEVLLTTGPIPNPKKAALEVIVTKLKAAIASQQLRELASQQQQQQEQRQQQEQLQGAFPFSKFRVGRTVQNDLAQPLAAQPGQPPAANPQLAQQLTQMVAMLQQATQQLQTLPEQVSSVPVRGDGSENDTVEAQVCLGMMNSPEGRRLSCSKKPEDVAAWQNLMLHWKEHDASAKQQAMQNQQPPTPKVSATVAVDKLAPPAQAIALKEMGLPISGPQDVEQPLEPHEVTRKTKGVNAVGAETEETVSMTGKRL